MSSDTELKALFKICAELQKHILQFHTELDDVWKEMSLLNEKISRSKNDKEH